MIRQARRMAARGAITVAISLASIGAHPPVGVGAERVAPPASGCFARDLARGSRGPDVAMLQRALNFVGLRRGRVDGFYGTYTRSAWSRWERFMGWRIDGVATLEELAWGACAPAPSPVATNAGADNPPVAVGGPPAPPAAPVDTIVISALGMERPIVVGIGSQAAINACVGAVLYAGTWPGEGTGTYLAAHRTSCGSKGFDGIQDLPAGSTVVVRHGGVSTLFRVVSITIANVGDPLITPPAGTLVMQTSKSGTAVWVVTATA